MHLLSNIGIAAEAIQHNKLRTLLTSLGIIFGVGSVIAMLSIGKGAEQEILEQLKALGANNVIVKAVVLDDTKKDDSADNPAAQKKKVWSPGLSIDDMSAISEEVPGVQRIAPEIMVECLAVHADKKRTAKLIGADCSTFDIGEYHLRQGQLFSAIQVQNASPVCVIGSGVSTKLFAGQNAVGQMLKCGDLWLSVIGVLDAQQVSEKTLEHLGIRDENFDVYAPYTTVLSRFRNRSLLTKKMINEAAREQNDDEKLQKTAEEKNPNQLDRIIVQLSDSKTNQAVADVLSRLLARRHHAVADFEVIVPELLLRQEQRTKDIFNVVLGAIAGISLLVGGIGIMNIMLASVLERTKEIGTRRAVGATRRDIVAQFLSEAISLSLGGGILGIAVGVGLSFGIERGAGIHTQVSLVSIALSFAVAAVIGLVFGIVPARRAAALDPIVALRYE